MSDVFHLVVSTLIVDFGLVRDAGGLVSFGICGDVIGLERIDWILMVKWEEHVCMYNVC